MLKAKSREEGSPINYTSFETFSGHVWKCVCRARKLPDDQETKLHFATNGRACLEPALPLGYFGNAIFTNNAIAIAGEIVSIKSKLTYKTPGLAITTWAWLPIHDVYFGWGLAIDMEGLCIVLPSPIKTEAYR
ncbi:hypothetical protein QVD17_38758 [Tagetes erecta]|uniref:Uncharacterized protein n=1 Tax=Tagetes erecta TaxID=13708 RepID=A0AAD8NFM3_TARER|nr:hypothetical protein QVD17_38758 [Tagetes erecta]